MMVAGVAVYDVQILDFVEVMLGGISGVYACYARVESATQDGGQAGVFKAFL